jgi:hypothetical protein
MAESKLTQKTYTTYSICCLLHKAISEIRQLVVFFFYLRNKVISTRASPLGIPRDIYKVTSQIRSQNDYHLGIVDHFGLVVVLVLLRILISFRFTWQRVEDVAGGVYVVL